MQLSKIPPSSQSCRVTSVRSRIAPSGFTLVEILVVISIIAVLASIVIGVQKQVFDKQTTNRAKGELQTIALALEQYKLKYGDYPWINSGGATFSEEEGRLLYKALVGLAVPRKVSGGLRLEEVDGGSSEAGPAFVDASKLSVEIDDDDVRISDSQAIFLDPWDNPYEYYYIEAGSSLPKNPRDRFELWSSKSFVILSKGPDGEKTGDTEYYSKGKLPSSAQEYYEEDSSSGQTNLDNIVHNYVY